MAQHVRDIMTGTPVSVETGALVTDVARLMRDEPSARTRRSIRQPA
ncbi:hypothetical protein [Streptomyces olivochromogenes]|nr:hypothetical protein [Streptomyces olivochromogenes]